MARDADPAAPAHDDAASLYLGLLRRCLTRELFIDEEYAEVFVVPPEVERLLEGTRLRVMRPTEAGATRADGRDYPPYAETMVGNLRLENVQDLATRVVRDGVPGDLVETGVWRGGTVILMRAVLAAYGDTTRRVWVCDSFQGLPEPDVASYPKDAEMTMSAEDDLLMKGLLAVSVDQVRANFERYGLLDDQVAFVEGWFRDSLPSAPIEQISLLRLDGDLYESTMDALVHLEPRVADGGYVIVDDYNGIDACRQAVDDYRSTHGITAPIVEVDWTGVWWQKGT